MRIMPFSGAPILNAAVHRMYAWHVPVYAEAQFCFKSFADDLVNVAVKLNIYSSFGH